MELEAWCAPSSVWSSDDGCRICDGLPWLRGTISCLETSLWSKEDLIDWVSCRWESWDSLMPLPFLLSFLAMPTHY